MYPSRDRNGISIESGFIHVKYTWGTDRYIGDIQTSSSGVSVSQRETEKLITRNVSAVANSFSGTTDLRGGSQLDLIISHTLTGGRPVDRNAADTWHWRNKLPARDVHDDTEVQMPSRPR